MRADLSIRNLAFSLFAFVATGCGGAPEPVVTQPAETAEVFVQRVNREMTDLGREVSMAGFIYATVVRRRLKYSTSLRLNDNRAAPLMTHSLNHRPIL